VPEQEIRFCAAGDARVAFATVGSGPPLLVPALWISHLELEWGFEDFRSFVGALARDRTVVRYDRVGTGLSDRPAAPEISPEAEVRTIAAVADALGLAELSLLGISWGACSAAAFAAAFPGRVRSLVLVGSYARGSEVAPAALQAAMADTVRAHWGAGSRLLADVWIPGADAGARDRFARLQRAAATPEVAAAMLEVVYRTDMRDVLARVRAPALVIHRRDDRAMPFAQGREVASLLPDAQFVAAEGDAHPPWLGDSRAIIAAVRRFLAEHDPAPGANRETRLSAPLSAPDSPLSAREAEVLRLVADGLSDAAIAARLIVSPHTVHRHVANIRTKLVSRRARRPPPTRRAAVSSSGADDQRSDQRRHPAPAARRELLDRQSGTLEQLERRLVAAAAHRERMPEAGEPVLPAGEPRRVRAHVLDQEQPAVRGEHAPHLGERRIGVGDRAQHERRDHGVERAVGERQLLGARVDDGNLAARGAARQPGAHRRIGLADHELDAVGVVAQVEPGAGTELEDTTARRGEQLTPARGHSPSLTEGEEGVVDEGDGRHGPGCRSWRHAVHRRFRPFGRRWPVQAVWCRNQSSERDRLISCR
jgi:pimeloyl-ACP methyl ester carboxylesterase/DNA-binding CsgD family transcriptional regulator